jgi:hypothetical protein
MKRHERVLNCLYGLKRWSREESPDIFIREQVLR